MNKIWYSQEAENWNEALPFGNGFLGAMVFSKTGKERIQINEDSLWSGGSMDRVNDDCKDNYKQVRDYLTKGEISKAELLAEQTMYATYPHMRHYQTLADVWIDFYDQRGKKSYKEAQGGLLNLEYELAEVEDYRRELNLNNAVGNTYYKIENKEFEREYFCSFPDNIFVYRIKNNEGINFDVSVTRKDNRSGIGASYCDGIEIINNNTIRLFGSQGGYNGISFEILVEVLTLDGNQRKTGGHILVENSKDTVIYITARTSYRSENPLKWCTENLEKKNAYTYEQLKERHVTDYKKYYFSSNLKFDRDEELEKLPSNERIRRIREGKEDTGFINIYYNFARYLLISSSRTGSLPANLQGIWNDEFSPCWGSKYTININIQMNYWIAEKTGLSKLHMPLLEHLKVMYPRGKEVASRMYGIDGFCCHHNTDIWGDCAPQDSRTSSTLWPMGGAWLCLKLIEHYQYTKDAEFVEEYMDILEDSVKFFINYMIKNDDGKWINGPSSSPENIYLNSENESGCLCVGATMDTEIIKDLFNGYLYILNETGINRELKKTVEKRLHEFPELKVGKYGQICEWSVDYDEIEPGHRHMSQLYGLYPSAQIRMDKTPELANAARTTIERRLKYGGGHTGWSKALIILFYARLWDGNTAWKNINELIGLATQDNVLNSHPPFQIDGNFGGACGILECLLQDYGDETYILPALPDELKNGSFSGIVLKNGAIIDLEWTDKKPKYIKVEAKRNFSGKFIYNAGKEIKVSLKKGESVIINNF